MSKDLTVSGLERQNILNNPYALEEIKNAVNLDGIKFENKFIFFKENIAEFFEVSTRTIENYLSNHENELKNNGYEVLRGKRLQELKEIANENSGAETIFGTKTTVIGIFDFRAFLNLAMLMTESERATLLRQAILDIVIDTINKKTGGSTKYINQRDEDFVISYFQEENYRKEFTNALNIYTNMGNFKYSVYTDKIYKSIFKENAKEYRKILKLQEKDSLRDTFYSEVLDLISSYEYGFAKIIEDQFNKNKTPLNYNQTDVLFKKFEQQPHWKPFIIKARNKMASRDLAFRDTLHLSLKEYITPLNSDEFERFLGEKSKELVERLEEAKDVFKRLKERE